MNQQKRRPDVLIQSAWEGNRERPGAEVDLQH